MSCKPILPLVSVVLLALVPSISGPSARAQDAAPTGAGWQYTLLNGSFLLDDCLICGRPSFFIPMQGTFRLRLVSENPISSTYALEDIEFTAGDEYRVTGEGEYVVSGEVALIQTLKLDVQIQTSGGTQDAFLESDPAAPSRQWPMLFASAKQTNGTFIHTFTLDVAGAPLRELWFSTRHGLTSGSDPKPIHISDGDLLSSTGRVVKTQQQLREAFGFDLSSPDLGLDSASVLPGGRIAFSTRDSATELRDGDWVDDGGSVLARYEDLLTPFAVTPPIPPVGLKAIQRFESGELWFAIRDDAFSESLSRTLGHGDILSSKGTVARDHAELVSRFNPPAREHDYGLGALYVWPNGEIWFSVEEGFQDDNLGPIQPGDLLSDAGYIVFRNLKLLQPFSPLEDLADFGLDAVDVISDALPVSPPPIITSVKPDAATGGFLLSWTGAGRVFQVLQADEADGPYLPVSPIIPGRSYLLQSPPSNPAMSFFRLMQW